MPNIFGTFGIIPQFLVSYHSFWYHTIVCRCSPCNGSILYSKFGSLFPNRKITNFCVYFFEHVALKFNVPPPHFGQHATNSCQRPSCPPYHCPYHGRCHRDQRHTLLVDSSRQLLLPSRVSFHGMIRYCSLARLNFHADL